MTKTDDATAKRAQKKADKIKPPVARLAPNVYEVTGRHGVYQVKFKRVGNEFFATSNCRWPGWNYPIAAAARKAAVRAGDLRIRKKAA